MKKVQSLSQYIEEICSLEDEWGTSATNNILYRGQGSSNWNLRPGLYRDYENLKAKGGPPEYMLKRLLTSAEINSLNGFMHKGIFFDKSYKDFTKLEWYFLAQHYGLKTRLLDWTTSYLVALFFAIESVCSGDTPIVYIMDPNWLNFQFHFIDGSAYLAPYIFNRDIPEGLFETIEPELKKLDLDLMSYINYESRNFYPFPIAIKPMSFDERLYHQKAYFTVHGHIYNFYDLLINDPTNEAISEEAISENLFHLISYNLFGEKKLKKSIEAELMEIIKTNMKNVEARYGKENRISKVVIDHNYIPKIRSELIKAGIDYGNIYPGLEGLAKDMNQLLVKDINNISK